MAQTVPPPTPPGPPAQPTPEPPPARLLEIKTVYLLKMARGLHQYLAHQLTNGQVLVVATDPLRADAILTDRVGKEFEEEMEKIYPAREDPNAEAESTAGSPGEVKGDRQPDSTWGRGRGTVFLVDRPTRNILWAHYAPSASSRSQDMESAAKKIAGKLRDDLADLRNPSKKGLSGK